MKRLALLLVLAGGGPAWSQQTAEYIAEVDKCFAIARRDGDLSCVGEASNRCQESTQGGSSTLGIVDCNASEAAAWDVILQREYRAARSYAVVLDNEDPSAAGSVVEIVENAQRAWLAFREAECLMAYAGWGGGSMRNIASSACDLRMTAERAVALRSWYHVEPEQ